MTNQHPIIPSSDLMGQWIIESDMPGQDVCEGVAIRAAQWGADQELEACGRWIEDQLCMPPDARADVITKLNGSRRPKPPSLKEQALNDLDTIQTHDSFGFQIIDLSNIRRALEALDD